MNQPPVVIVIGGGISGLSAAHRFRQLNPDSNVQLWEASQRVGGVIQTERTGNFVIEQGPDMFTTKEPDALELCRELGLESHLLNTNSENRGARVVKKGKLHPVPMGMSLLAPHRMKPILKTPLLSPWGKARLFGEYFVAPKKMDQDESLESFAVRRFGRDAFEWLVQPLISGIYTADPKLLSMRATLAEFLEMEQNHGSILRGVFTRKRAEKNRAEKGTTSRLAKEEAQASGARYGLFLAPRFGMQDLTEALEQQLPAGTISLNSTVDSIEPSVGGKWMVRGKQKSLEADGVVVAIPAVHAAGLFESSDKQLSEQLETVRYASSAVAVMVVDRAEIRHPLNCFGMVVPNAENRKILAASFSSLKFSGRAPQDQVIIRVFIGGACQPELLTQTDDQLMELARRELSELIGLSTKANTSFEQIVRWNRAMPQYTLGHQERVAEMERCVERHAHLELAGNAYHGVGIPFCIRSGRLAAERLDQSLRNRLAEAR